MQPPSGGFSFWSTTIKRTLVYPGAIPLETDILNLNKNVLTSIGHLLQDMLGTSTLFSGLGCVPTGPAGMTVNVNPGRAYSYQAIDTGAYSSLSADAHMVVKQGILLDAVNFSCPAPTTAGFSVNYLVQGAFQEVDSGSVTLPYYNASNPATAYSGPNNTGTSNTTYRDNTVQLQLKAGTAATTGSQVTPTPDSGFNGLWVVTVPFGASTITAANITQYAGAPFLSGPISAGRLLRTSVYTNVSGTQFVSVNGGTPTSTGATTFVPLPLTSFIIGEAQGGGNAGGGATLPGSGNISLGSPGGCGAYGKGYFSAASVGASQTITVGAGGAGVSGAAGGVGGSSSIGALLSAPGGLGSSSLNNFAAANTANGNSSLTAAPTGANLVSSKGGCPSISFVINAAVGAGMLGGAGAPSIYGPGGPGGIANIAPSAASGNFGSGGCAVVSTSVGSALAGGAGSPGVVIIQEFA